MATISLRGTPVKTSGDLPELGQAAPDFKLVNQKLQDVSLANFPDKIKLLSIVPSLDTPVCSQSTIKFNEAAERYDNTVFLTISADLPFAMSRFCSFENLNNVMPLSMMRSRKFALDYGVLMEDGPLAGITARAIVIINQQNSVIYTELVHEISHEPDYQQAFQYIN